ncbi:NAD(P)-dependent oxidoreductase [soil metagenome]|nr:NAD(P)-dependent oxidoreductase [Gemmatimonadota bacterium]
MTAKVLVTGSSGFIGSNLVPYLAVSGHEVLGLDRNPPREPGGRYGSVECDLLDREKLLAIVAAFSPDCILHLAARTDLEETTEIAGYAANTTGVENLIDAIEATPAVKRCVFTSSQMVCRPGHIPRDENDYAPHTLYGESKVLGERIVRARDGGGVEWCITRPTTVWGPGMSAHYQRFLRMIKAGSYFHVGKRPLCKSYGYIGNVVHQYRQLIEAPADRIVRRVFYQADYQPLSLQEWTNEFQRAFAAPPIRTFPAGLVHAAAAVGDAIHALGWRRFPFTSFRLNNVLTEYCFDLRPTEAVCGPLPYSMREGVTHTVEWMLHPDAPAESARPWINGSATGADRLYQRTGSR